MSCFPSADKTGLDAVTRVGTVCAVQKVTVTKKRSSTYVKYLLPQRFKKGKYACKNGSTNIFHKFQNEFLTLKESTATAGKLKILDGARKEA